MTWPTNPAIGDPHVRNHIPYIWTGSRWEFDDSFVPLGTNALTTAVRAAGVADDLVVPTEKAVRDAIAAAFSALDIIGQNVGGATGVANNAALVALIDVDATAALEEGDWAVLNVDSTDNGETRVAGLYVYDGTGWPTTPLIPLATLVSAATDAVAGIVELATGVEGLNTTTPSTTLVPPVAVVQAMIAALAPAQTALTTPTTITGHSILTDNASTQAQLLALGNYLVANPITDEVVRTDNTGSAAIVAATPPAGAKHLFNTSLDKFTHHVEAGAWVVTPDTSLPEIIVTDDAGLAAIAAAAPPAGAQFIWNKDTDQYTHDLDAAGTAWSPIAAPTDDDAPEILPLATFPTAVQAFTPSVHGTLIRMRHAQTYTVTRTNDADAGTDPSVEVPAPTTDAWVTINYPTAASEYYEWDGAAWVPNTTGATSPGRWDTNMPSLAAGEKVTYYADVGPDFANATGYSVGIGGDNVADPDKSIRINLPAGSTLQGSAQANEYAELTQVGESITIIGLGNDDYLYENHPPLVQLDSSSATPAENLQQTVDLGNTTDKDIEYAAGVGPVILAPDGTKVRLTVNSALQIVGVPV